MITAVDGEYVNGDTITSVLALGVVGKSVLVRALCPDTQSCSSQVIEVELKRRKAGTGACMPQIDLFVPTQIYFALQSNIWSRLENYCSKLKNLGKGS